MYTICIVFVCLLLFIFFLGGWCSGAGRADMTFFFEYNINCFQLFAWCWVIENQHFSKYYYEDIYTMDGSDRWAVLSSWQMHGRLLLNRFWWDLFHQILYKSSIVIFDISKNDPLLVPYILISIIVRSTQLILSES
jgi:hypothetical protein